ncbi:hypothetical protein [Rhizobium sp. AAP43]|uniref:hypothetical protein n=1 Tax=Rhizobium sp. AAP43 TaxID=1523420 RepID=UPI0006B8D8AF|nr:hypothetical protein [Rhizobium sp. AAP43]KPF46520.1 hypothetical protein IP76_06570 [Rhizobium sp. AAP43]
MGMNLRVAVAVAGAVTVVVPGLRAAEPVQSVSSQEEPAQIVQQVVGRQEARQVIGWTDVKLAKTARQVASNAGNIVEVEARPLDSVSQTFDGQQFSINDIVLNAVSALEGIEQEASNTANAVVGGTVGRVEQNFVDGASQHAFNTLSLPELAGTIRQSGINTINLIHSKESVAISSQNFAEQAEQVIENRLTVTGVGGGGAIVQEGTNIGNVIVAGKVTEVVRDFAGDQIINNVVTVQEGADWGSISQGGTNIANYIEAESIGTLSQTSTGRQFVTNQVELVTLAGLTEQLTTPGIEQRSSNYVNVIVLKAPAVDDVPATIDVSQTGDYEQSVSGASGGATQQTGNSVSIDR